jgi:hypothetical protein
MPNETAVFWINNPEFIARIIENVVKGDQLAIKSATQWFEIINQHCLEEVSAQIWKSIKTIISKE